MFENISGVDLDIGNTDRSILLLDSRDEEDALLVQLESLFDLRQWTSNA